MKAIPSSDLWVVTNFNLAQIPLNETLILRMDFLPAMQHEGEQVQQGLQHVLSIEMARLMALQLTAACDRLESARSPSARH